MRMMNVTGPKTAVEDSSDSDGNETEGPSPAEKRTIGRLYVLLKKGQKFVNLYEKQQSDLQQIIYQQFKRTEDFYEKFRKATIISLVGGISGLIGGCLAVFLVAMCIGLALSNPPNPPDPWIIEVGCVIFKLGVLVFVFGGVILSIGLKMQQLAIETLKEVRKAQQTFRSTAEAVFNPLNKICSLADEILKCHKESSQKSLDFRQCADILSAVTEILKPPDLQRLAQKITDKLLSDCSDTLDLIINVFATISDLDKLIIQTTVQEHDLQTITGKLILQMRQNIHHLQNILNQMMCLRSEMQKVLIPKLNQYFD